MIPLLTVIVGLTGFTLAIAVTEARAIWRREMAYVRRTFGHSHRIYPPSAPVPVPPGRFRPDLRAPLGRVIHRS